MIKCSKCGFDNQPHHLFCAQCRTKMDLGHVTKECFSQLKKINGKHTREIMAGAILFALVLLGLAFWPQKITPVDPSGTEGAMARRKVTALQQGTAVSHMEFSEKEVNLLFNFIIQENARRIGLLPKLATLENGYVKIRPNALIISLGYRIGPWMLGSLTIGPFRLTFKAATLPQKNKDGLHLTAQKGAIGHLPLYRLGGRLTNARLRALFRPFKNARNLLNRLEIIEMKKGEVVVSAGR